MCIEEFDLDLKLNSFILFFCLIGYKGFKVN